MRIRRIAAILTLVGLTVVIAPLGYGTAKGLMAGKEHAERMDQSYALMEAYRAHSPPPLTLYSMDFTGTITGCGYDPERLFGERFGSLGPDDAWSPYRGYLDLFSWRGKEWRDAADLRRLDFLMTRTSAFSSEFLRVCLRQSLFAPLCSRRVAAILEAGEMDGPGLPEPRIDQRRQTRSICTYLDGIAARQRLPLATRAQGGPGQ